MKKKLAMIAALALFFSVWQTGVAFAAPLKEEELVTEQVISSVTEYYEDGSYDVTEVAVCIDGDDLVGENVASTQATSGSITGSKLTTHYDSSKNKLYALKVYGTFFYNGSTVSCNGRSYQTYVYNSAWTVENVTTAASGNGTEKAASTASGNGVKHLLGIPIQYSDITVTVYCSKTGKLS